MARRKVKRKYEVQPGTYRVEWDWAQEPPTEEPPMESSVEFEYKGGTWFDFDDKWMDVFVEHAKPKVTKDGDKLGEMHHFAAEGPSIPTGPPKQPPILLKDSCCCGATKENPCDCMIMGIMECSATCPCSQNPRHQEKWAIYGAEGTEENLRLQNELISRARRKIVKNLLMEAARSEYEWDKTTDDWRETYPQLVQADDSILWEDYMATWRPVMHSYSIAEIVGVPQHEVKEIAESMGFGSDRSVEDIVLYAEDAEDYGVQPTWMAETEGPFFGEFPFSAYGGPSESKSNLDSTNLTDWANANDSDDIKYLVGGFIGGVLATAVGAIAGEWAVQRMKKHGKLL